MPDSRPHDAPFSLTGPSPRIPATDTRLPGVLGDPLLQGQKSWAGERLGDFVGSVRLPLGIAGPLRITGLHARGDYSLPLATTHPGLIAACGRGLQVIAEAGGCVAMILDEGLGRGLRFGLRTLQQAGLFAHWVISHVDGLRRAAAASPEARLIDIRVTVESNHVHLFCEFAADDADPADVDTATEAIRAHIRRHSPVRLLEEATEDSPTGLPSGILPVPTVRGRRACAETILSADLVTARLERTPLEIAASWQGTAAGRTDEPPWLSGRALAALFAACGQEVAGALPAARGLYRFAVTPQHELYAAVTLPHLLVRTVGGGTELPAQRACLELLGLAGPGRAPALAEICAGLCLAAALADAGAHTREDLHRSPPPTDAEEG